MTSHEYFAYNDDALDELENLMNTRVLSREEHNDLGKHLCELDNFAMPDAEDPSKRVLSLADAISKIEKRGYVVDAVKGISYYALQSGRIQSFVAFLGEVLVVLWVGKSGLSQNEQEDAKTLSSDRLHAEISTRFIGDNN